MPKTVIMPKFGMTQEDAVLVAWKVADGNRIERGDPLCEVTIDKINMVEVEGPAIGVVAEPRSAPPATPVASRIARDGKLRPDDVAGASFTLSNLGMFGLDNFTAIINPPQVAILAVGQVAKRFRPDDADLRVARDIMTVTLSVDHRAIDGAVGAGFLATPRAILETAGAQWG